MGEHSERRGIVIPPHPGETENTIVHGEGNDESFERNLIPPAMRKQPDEDDE